MASVYVRHQTEHKSMTQFVLCLFNHQTMPVLTMQLAFNRTFIDVNDIPIVYQWHTNCMATIKRPALSFPLQKLFRQNESNAATAFVYGKFVGNNIGFLQNKCIKL